MDILTWLVLAALFFFVFRRMRGSEKRASKERPALSYHRIEGDKLALEPSGRVVKRNWEAQYLEDVPFARRRRLILTITVAESVVERSDLESLLWSLATQLQERAMAHVVVIEAFVRDHPVHAGHGLLRLLFAPDGRGWSGEERVIAVVEGKDNPAHSLSLSETHARVIGAT